MRPFSKPSRKINWVSSSDSSDAVEDLEQRMAEYYRQPRDYYDNIREGTTLWDREDAIVHVAITRALKGREKVLEVGCGEAAILASGRVSQKGYFGCDFSKSLTEVNAIKYPAARFACLESPDALPYPDGVFDAVFSVFVIEHSARPAEFLRECARVLRSGGQFMLLCPDFLDAGWMASQRVGFSHGTGREKLRAGRLLDAAVTGFDQRIRIPMKCWLLRHEIKRSPRFYVNLAPTCFTDPFRPDVDAVYVTCSEEMRRHLEPEIRFSELEASLDAFVRKNRYIFLMGSRF